jgi:hypothetical protein
LHAAHQLLGHGCFAGAARRHQRPHPIRRGQIAHPAVQLREERLPAAEVRGRLQGMDDADLAAPWRHRSSGPGILLGVVGQGEGDQPPHLSHPRRIGEHRGIGEAVLLLVLRPGMVVGNDPGQYGLAGGMGRLHLPPGDAALTRLGHKAIAMRHDAHHHIALAGHALALAPGSPGRGPKRSIRTDCCDNRRIVSSATCL